MSHDKHHGVSANVNMSRDSHVTTDNSRMYKLLESVQEIKWMAMHFSIFQCLENPSLSLPSNLSRVRRWKWKRKSLKYAPIVSVFLAWNFRHVSLQAQRNEACQFGSCRSG